MKGKRYYLTIVNGEDACVLCGPADISEIDLMTLFTTKEDFLDVLNLKYHLFVPNDSDICIIQLKEDNQNLEYLRIYEPLFLMNPKNETEDKLATLFPYFAINRASKIQNHKQKISIEDTENEGLNYKDFVTSLLKYITSNSKIKSDFVTHCTLLSNHVHQYLETYDPLEPFNLKKLLEDLKQYKELRNLYVEYLNYYKPEKAIKKGRRIGYYKPFKKALYEYEKEGLQKAKEEKNKDEEYSEKLLAEFEKGIISWEEFLERTEYKNKGKDIGYYR